MNAAAADQDHGAAPPLLAGHVLRHWEDVGLLAPARDAAGRRWYGESDLLRIAMIVQGKELHFTLDQICSVLTADDPAERRAELRRQHAELTRRIEQAEQARQVITHALECPAENFLDCPRMRRPLTARVPRAPRARP